MHKINAQQTPLVSIDSFPMFIHLANDMEKIFSEIELNSLDSLLKNFEIQSCIQLKLITVDSIYMANYD